VRILRAAFGSLRSIVCELFKVCRCRLGVAVLCAIFFYAAVGIFFLHCRVCVSVQLFK
jgi:hypothetical protein